METGNPLYKVKILAMSTKKSDREYSAGGVAFVGSMLLGLGLGLWFDHAISGLLAGSGVGFIAMAFFAQANKK